MSKRSIEVLDGEYYIDMNKKPCKTIWEAAAINNKRPLKVRRHVCRDDSALWGVDMEWQNTKIKKPYYGQVVILKIDGVTQDVTFVFDGADDTCDWFEPYNFNEPEHGVFDDFKHELEWVPLPK